MTKPEFDDGEFGGDDSADLGFSGDSFLHLSLPATYSATGPASSQQFTNLVSPAAFGVSVDPVVLFSILDHYLRRNQNTTRVIGAILGVRSEDGSEVEIRSCFPLAMLSPPQLAHAQQQLQAKLTSQYNFLVQQQAALQAAETTDGATAVVLPTLPPSPVAPKLPPINVDYLNSMHALHFRVNPKETLLGWYSTGTVGSIDEVSALVHEYFATEKMGPYPAVHVLVDTELAGSRMGVKAFVASPVAAPGAETPGSMFVQIPCDVKTFDAERSGLDIVASARDAPSKSSTLLSDMDSLERSILLVREKIDQVHTYVNKVLDGKVKSDTGIGRFLMDAVSSIPRIDADEFETMFSNHLQDTLMVVYLANLTRTQLAIAERLQKMSGDAP